MTGKKKESEVAIRFSAMSIDEFNLANPKILARDGLDLLNKSHEIKFTIGFAAGVLEPNNILQIVVGVQIFTVVDGKKKNLGSFHATFDILIPTLKGYYEIKNKNLIKFNLPEKARRACITEAYSTARGMFYTKGLGTFMSGITLPIVNSDKLLTQLDVLQVKNTATEKSKKNP